MGNSPEEDDMRDEMDARIWTANHEEFSSDMQALFGTVRKVFSKLVEIQFEAPWERARPLQPARIIRRRRR